MKRFLPMFPVATLVFFFLVSVPGFTQEWEIQRMMIAPGTYTISGGGGNSIAVPAGGGGNSAGGSKYVDVSAFCIDHGLGIPSGVFASAPAELSNGFLTFGQTTKDFSSAVADGDISLVAEGYSAVRVVNKRSEGITLTFTGPTIVLPDIGYYSADLVAALEMFEEIYANGGPESVDQSAVWQQRDISYYRILGIPALGEYESAVERIQDEGWEEIDSAQSLEAEDRAFELMEERLDALDVEYSGETEIADALLNLYSSFEASVRRQQFIEGARSNDSHAVLIDRLESPGEPTYVVYRPGERPIVANGLRGLAEAPALAPDDWRQLLIHVRGDGDSGQLEAAAATMALRTIAEGGDARIASIAKGPPGFEPPTPPSESQFSHDDEPRRFGRVTRDQESAFIAFTRTESYLSAMLGKVRAFFARPDYESTDAETLRVDLQNDIVSEWNRLVVDDAIATAQEREGTLRPYYYALLKRRFSEFSAIDIVKIQMDVSQPSVVLASFRLQ